MGVSEGVAAAAANGGPGYYSIPPLGPGTTVAASLSSTLPGFGASSSSSSSASSSASSPPSSSSSSLLRPQQPPPTSQSLLPSMAAQAAAGTGAPPQNMPQPPPSTQSATGSGANDTAGSGQIRKRAAQDFLFGRVLGEGSYSTVIHAEDKSNGREYAIKMLDKKHILKEKKAKYVQIEKEVLNLVSHPFIVKLYYTFQSQTSLYFVLECAPNGDLLTFMRKRQFDVISSRFYTAEIIVGVEYLHSQGVIHRDLKPENVLIASNFHIKITDFGSAKILAGQSSVDNPPSQPENGKQKNSFVGTAEYCSPELLNDRAASFASDVWAIGCILFQLLSGRPPFKGSNEYQTFQKIIKLEYTIPPDFSREATEVIASILLLNPDSRVGLQRLKTMMFFADAAIDWDALDSQTPPVPPFRPEHVNEPAEEFHSSSIDELEMITNDPFEAGIRYPFEVAPPMPDGPVVVAKPLAPAPNAFAERQKALVRQRSSPLIALVASNELILLAGSVYKRKGLFSKRRGLMLTDLPRLSFFDEETYAFKGDIPWMEIQTVTLKDKKTLLIQTVGRLFTLQDLDQDAQRWIDAINRLRR